MSINSFTRKSYRLIANKLGSYLKIQKLNEIFFEREMLILIRKFNLIKTGDQLLELGTGWFHRYSTFIKLFYNVRISLFDVIDNRQINIIKHYIKSLSTLLNDEEMEIIRDKNFTILNNINTLSTITEYYRLMNFEYILNKNGDLTSFKSNSFNGIFSCNVFEHINCKDITISEYIDDIFRILKPGGFSLQIIDIGDHLHWLDTKFTNRKEYLKFSDKTWTKYFDSNLKYINRIQASQWLSLFENSGFKLIYKSQIECNIEPLHINNKYNDISFNDLKCTNLFIIHQKPK